MIIVLEEGRIAEMGHHRELIKKKGLYKQLYEMQFKYETAGEISEIPEYHSRLQEHDSNG
jgi:hypothetical protein